MIVNNSNYESIRIKSKWRKYGKKYFGSSNNKNKTVYIKDLYIKNTKLKLLEPNIDSYNGQPVIEQIDSIELTYQDLSYPYDTLNGWLTLGINQKAIIEQIGKPDSLGTDIYWGAIGKYVQEWKYKDLGVFLQMESNIKGGDKNVLMITITEPCEFKTSNTIGIGSNYDEVINTYTDKISKDFRGDNQIVIGSIYGGVIISFKDKKVSSIFIGSAAE